MCIYAHHSKTKSMFWKQFGYYYPSLANSKNAVLVKNLMGG